MRVVPLKSDKPHSGPSKAKRAVRRSSCGVLRKGMDPRVAGCGALPAVVQAAHIRPVADDGSDWGGNGIWLCRNHHALFDAGIWSVRPEDLAVVPADGYDLSSLLMDQSDLKHLDAAPFADAVQWRWEWFQERRHSISNRELRTATQPWLSG